MTQRAYRSGSSFPELKPGTLRLYSARICPYAERARLVLAHKNIPYEVVNIELADKPEWFLKVSPFGKVPVLQQGDTVLFESTAVCDYLDDVYQGDKLQAQDPYRKAQDRILLEYYGQYTSTYYGIIFSLRDEGKRAQAEEKSPQLLKHFKHFDTELQKRGSRYFAGSKPGMIDFLLWPHLERVPAISQLFPKEVMSPSECPRLCTWWQDMTQVPAVQKEMFDADWHRQIFILMNGKEPYGDTGLEE